MHHPNALLKKGENTFLCISDISLFFIHVFHDYLHILQFTVPAKKSFSLSFVQLKQTKTLVLER